MIPDVEERSHIERYVGSSLIVKSHGYGKQQTNYRQYQNTRYPKYVNDGGAKNENRNAEHTGQRYPFSPKTTGLYRNADSRANCWSGYPLISFNAGRRDNPNADQPRHYYANNTLKSYGNTKPSKCSYSDFVTNKQGVPLIQAKFQEKQNWERENRNFHAKNHTETYKSIDNRENRKNDSTTDENFANSENCLPRIIKPRKRRKKDRKPNTTFTPTSNVQTPNTNKQEKNDAKSVYKIHQHGEKSSPDSSQILHNVHLTLYRPSKSKPLYQDGNVNDLLISRSLVNLFSEDSPQLLLTDDLRFDNFLAKETTADSQTTFCNCRYCDPEGVVWDIRQRCFSPNLMPPVDGAKNTLKLVKNKDWTTTLKRSCSEPASKPTSTPVVSRVRALSDSYDTTNQNLQVSSEIVTSLNGHRDIEIKFFSSSTPTTKV